MANSEIMQAENARKFLPVFRRIRALARERELTNVDLSRRAEVSYRTVFAVMHEEPRALQDRILAKFARALGTTADYLLTGEGEKSMIREGGPAWDAKSGGSDAANISLRDAFRKIAQELDMSEDSVVECFGECYRRTKGANPKTTSQARQAAVTPATTE